MQPEDHLHFAVFPVHAAATGKFLSTKIPFSCPLEYFPKCLAESTKAFNIS